MLNAHYANLTENHLQYSGVTKNTILQTENSEGVYTICVKAFTITIPVLLSFPLGMHHHHGHQYDPPMILLPTHNGTVLCVTTHLYHNELTPPAFPNNPI